MLTRNDLPVRYIIGVFTASVALLGFGLYMLGAAFNSLADGETLLLDDGTEYGG